MKPNKKTAAPSPKATIQHAAFLPFRVQLLLLGLLSFVLYFNTIFNEYALDDGLVIHENPFTKQGFAGIDEILSHDSYYGYYQQFGSEGELTGGRYRPLSIITFAIEWEIFGENPQISHLVNVLLYVLTVLLLLVLMNKYLFRNQPVVSFVAALIFAIHPIHTEVVANIKSRDELLSLLFLVLTLIYLFRYATSIKQLKELLLSLVFYSLALLSKENGITFLAVIPLALYMFTSASAKKAFVATAPFAAIAGVYLVLRFMAVGAGSEEMTDIMNNPFAYATTTEKYATIFFIMLKYLGLLIFPHPLSYDYGYNEIAYRTFADPLVLLSIVVYAGLFIYAVLNIKKGHILSFAILFYLLTFSIVSNLFVEIGATMGERLLYHSSVGFAIAIGYFIVKLFSQVNLPLNNIKKPAGWAVILVLVVLAGYKTIARNADWKNNTTLFIADVEAVPNSVKANTAAATSFTSLARTAPDPQTKQQYLKQALQHLQKAAQIHPDFADIFLNMGVIYYEMDDIDNMVAAWNRARQLQPNHPKLKEYEQFMPHNFMKLGVQFGARGDFENAILYLNKAVKHNPNDVEAWYNLGGAYFSVKNYSEAAKAFAKALEINPEHEQARAGLMAARGQMQ